MPVVIFINQGVNSIHITIGATMKHPNKIARALMVCLVFAVCLSTTIVAYASSTTATVNLTESQSSAFSGVVSCRTAAANARNNSTSKYSVKLCLQLSAGSSWGDYGVVEMSPGTRGETGEWGRKEGTIFLARAQLCVSGFLWDSTGCTASGSVNVVKPID